MLRFPLTAYLSSSATVVADPVGPPTRVGRVPIVATPVVLELVVDVLVTTVVPRKSAKTSRALTNCSTERFEDDPIDATTAPETRTASLTRSTPVSV